MILSFLISNGISQNLAPILVSVLGSDKTQPEVGLGSFGKLFFFYCLDSWYGKNPEETTYTKEASRCVLKTPKKGKIQLRQLEISCAPCRTPSTHTDCCSRHFEQIL